jgi:enoyl-CoA hydratase
VVYETIITQRNEDNVGYITLNRPEALNALNAKMMEEMCKAALSMDVDDNVSVIVILGSKKAFAAGADIKEMASLSFADAYSQDLFGGWDALSRVRKPLVAAVSGFALGGGCELAMMCDLIIASETAKFGQPEIKLGIIPGMGGTQRMTRAIGKAKAMDMMLTGRMISAVEAEAHGLVARVVPAERFGAEVEEFAAEVAGKSQISARMVKEAINAAFETPLADGLRFERRASQSAFATGDQKEGMAAFIEKRLPKFSHR